jgi:hypothetical protein
VLGVAGGAGLGLGVTGADSDAVVDGLDPTGDELCVGEARSQLGVMMVEI